MTIGKEMSTPAPALIALFKTLNTIFKEQFLVCSYFTTLHLIAANSFGQHHHALQVCEHVHMEGYYSNLLQRC